MSEKRLKALVTAVAILFLVWLGVSFIPSGSGGPPEASGALAGFFEGVTPEAVTAVRLQGPGGQAPVELRRVDGGWTVNGFRADSALVAGFWTSLENAEVGSMVASNPDNHSRLGVSQDSTWQVKLELPAGSRTLFVGKPGSRYGTTYVRLPDEDKVYLLDGNLRTEVTRALDGWRNKRLARVDTASVNRLAVQREGEAYTLSRADSTWTLEDGQEADAGTVRSLLGELVRLDASGFYAPGDTLTEPGGSLVAVGESGDTLFSMEVGSGEGDRWARVPGDSITYRLASWRVSSLLPEKGKVEGGE